LTIKNRDEFPEAMTDLIDHIFEYGDIEINEDYDLDRIYFKRITENGVDEFFIRLWTMTDKFMEWTLFYVDKTGKAFEKRSGKWTF
jgi:hypothetical protein